MAAALATQAKQVQKVFIEWCVKAAEIILHSRLEPPLERSEVPPQTSASFNLKVPELFNVRGEAVARPEFFQVRTQRSFQIEIYLHPPDADDVANAAELATPVQPGTSRVPNGRAACEDDEEEAGRLLERWTFAFFPAHPEPTVPDRCNQTLVRKLSCTLRSLLCYTHLLPAYGVCRGPRPAPGRRRYRFRVEAWPPTSRTPAQEMLTQDFASLQSSVGTLRLSVSYWKDLQSIPAGSLTEGTTMFGSQIDQIKVEEGYVSGAAESPNSTSAHEASMSLGRLGKIAEEPEAKASSRLAGSGSRAGHVAVDGSEPIASTTASPSYGEVVLGSAREKHRPRSGSDASDSNLSTRSTSSRGHSVQEHTIVLGSTPPLATAAFNSGPPPPGLISLGPQRSDSACSSRSVTPGSTPKLGPSPEPMSAPSSARGKSATASTVAACSTAASPRLCGEQAGDHRGRPATGSSTPTSMPGGGLSEVRSTGVDSGRPGGACRDDLSDLWASYPHSWSRRRSMSSFGSASRGTNSRSLSPEDPVRTSAAASETGDGGRTSGACGESVEPRGEICMLGMSDDEEEEAASEDENVVASALQESNAGAFIGLASSCPNPVKGLSASLATPGLVASPTSPGSGTDQQRLSPLIAQLNPFSSPPPLSLPDPIDGACYDSPASNGTVGFTGSNPAEEANLYGSSRGALLAAGACSTGLLLGAGIGGSTDAAEALRAAAPASSAGATVLSPLTQTSASAGEAADKLQPLLVEMGDLLCKLRQRHELAITAQEVAAEDLLERLAHFTELAGSAEMQCRA